MADTVHVPGIKAPLPKWAVLGGVATVGVLIIVYYRSHSSTSSGGSASTAATGTGATAGTPATSSDPFPWDGTYGNSSDPNSMDPATGMTYGDEQTYGTSSGGGYGGGGGGGNGGSGGPPFTTNAEWAQWVIPQLEANDPALNAGAVQTAIGDYLAGQPLSASAQQIVFSAEGIAGPVPVAAASGYPPNIRGNGGKGGGGGGGGPKPGRPTGLHAVPRFSQATLTWRGSAHATGYRVRVWHSHTHQIVHDAVQPGTTLDLHGLARRSGYGWHVQAEDAAGHSPWAAASHFTTR